MSAGGGPREAHDDLRRRLYRADATPADVERYLAERAEEPAPEPQPPPPPPPTRQRRTLLLVAAALVPIALLVAAQLVHPVTAPAARPSPGVTIEVDVGDGQTLAVPAVTTARAAVVPVSVQGAAVTGRRFDGRGNAVVEVDPPAGADAGGRMAVSVTSSGRSSVEWRALLIVHGDDRTSWPIVLASGPADRPATFLYPVSPPTRIAVAADPGVRWTLVTGIAAGLEQAPG